MARGACWRESRVRLLESSVAHCVAVLLRPVAVAMGGVKRYLLLPLFLLLHWPMLAFQRRARLPGETSAIDCDGGQRWGERR